MQKIVLLLRKKYIQIPLIIISIFLQVVGIIALIGMHSYQKESDGRFGSWQYSYELSEKAALDTWKKNTAYYNQSPSRKDVLSNQKTFGEFRTWVELSQNVDGTKSIKSLFGDGSIVDGSLYINGKKYSAQFNSQTGVITYDEKDKSDRLGNWHWYNWLGLRMP